MGDRYDAVVVGASLAGCTTATLLGRAGLRVALVDKHTAPDAYKRLCGHYIQASAVPVLERLGLTAALEAAGAVRNGADLWTRWGVISSPEPEGERPYGYSIRRSKLDPMIRAVAAQTPGVEYRPGLRLQALAPGGSTFRDAAGRDVHLTAPLVVGADGRGSTTAELAGARERRSPNRRFCYMGYFSGVEIRGSARGQVWMLEPDVAIAAPNDDGLTLLAAFVHKDRLDAFRADREGAVRALFDGLPAGPGLADARLEGKLVGYTDYEIVRRDPVPRAGVALAGDAALTCDPTLAIGCGFALNSAQWLADAAAPALLGEVPLGKALAGYRRRHRRELGGHHRMLTQAAQAKPLAPPERLLFSAAARDPRLAARFSRYAERSIKPGRLLAPSTFARAARVSLRAA